MKRLLAATLCVMLLLSATTAYAAEPRAAVAAPTLTFSGTTANCTVQMASFGKTINITMELWYGNTLVDSWTKSGVSAVTIDEDCTVVSQRTYTLKVYGTCGGESFACEPVVKKCP